MALIGLVRRQSIHQRRMTNALDVLRGIQRQDIQAAMLTILAQERDEIEKGWEK